MMFGYRRGAPLYTLLLLSCMSFLLYVDRVNLSTAAGPISKDLGLTNTQLGIAFSAFGYSYAMFQVAGGWIADRVGARLTLLACGIVWVATTVGTGFVGGFAALLVVRFVLGIGEGATLPAAARALTNWTPPARRGFAQGITHSASRLGNAVAPPVVAALTLAYSWRTSFFVLGAITAVWVAIWWWYFRDDPRRHPAMRPDDLAGLPPFRAADAGRGPVPWLRLLRRTAPTMIVYFCYGLDGVAVLHLAAHFLPTGLRPRSEVERALFLGGLLRRRRRGRDQRHPERPDPRAHRRRRGRPSQCHPNQPRRGGGLPGPRFSDP